MCAHCPLTAYERDSELFKHIYRGGIVRSVFAGTAHQVTASE